MELLDWDKILSVLGHFAFTLVLVLPIALNREVRTNIMGLRTFPLVALGACAFVMTTLDFFPPAATDARSRVMQGILSGLGFVGGGAILKKDDHVRGTACAASIWSSGAIGAAVGYGSFEIAIFLAAANYVILSKFSQAKDGGGPEDGAISEEEDNQVNEDD